MKTHISLRAMKPTGCGPTVPWPTGCFRKAETPPNPARRKKHAHALPPGSRGDFPGGRSEGGRHLNYLADGIIQGAALIFSMDEEVWSAVSTTLSLSALSMAVTLLLGIPGGFALGYFSFPGKRGIRLLVDTFLSIPTVVVGLFVYAFISNRGPLGSWQLLFTIPGMAIGQTILALPIVIALTATAVESVDERLRLTLLTLGARGSRLLFSTLWEGRHQILLAAVTAYGRVTAEVGVSMMLGGNIKWHTRTVTTAITLETGKGDFATGIALGFLLLILSFLLNWMLSFLRKRASA